MDNVRFATSSDGSDAREEMPIVEVGDKGSNWPLIIGDWLFLIGRMGKAAIRPDRCPLCLY